VAAAGGGGRSFVPEGGRVLRHRRRVATGVAAAVAAWYGRRMSATLEEQLRAQLTTAIKGKDSRTANLVRMINTKVMERRTAKDFKGTVDDALFLDVIGVYKRSMEKARQEYEAAGNNEKIREQIAELDFEIAWCAGFLPAPATEDELRTAVAAVVAGLPAKDPKQAGRVIGAIKKQFGDRADAQLVKKLADEALSS
jgi:uncharacterized protein YqeY